MPITNTIIYCDLAHRQFGGAVPNSSSPPVQRVHDSYACIMPTRLCPASDTEWLPPSPPRHTRGYDGQVGDVFGLDAAGQDGGDSLGQHRLAGPGRTSWFDLALGSSPLLLLYDRDEGPQ